MNQLRLRRRASSGLMSVLIAVLLMPFGAGIALALGTLDQEALPGAASATTTSGPTLTQTFTAGLTGNLDTVALYGRTTGAYGSTWSVAIRAVDGGGAPTGPDLATGSAAGPASNGWTQITMTPAIPVTAGTVYAIDATAPSPFWFWTASPYGGGTKYLLGVPQSGDFALRTYVTVAPPEAPTIALAVSNVVATAQDGVYGPSATVPAGSTVWRKVGVMNNSTTGLNGMTFSDSGGPLPASCPALPTVIATGAAWSCTFSLAAATGTTTFTATATFGAVTATASATVTGTASGIAHATAATKLGLPSAAGSYTTSTKVASLGQYVTWQSALGSAAAGKTVGVYLSARSSDGSWGAWTRITGRMADASGTVVFSRREAAASWLSVRFSLDGAVFTDAAQARWR